MSPEQVQGLPLDGRSDVYSLGIVLFELLTGSTPFRADTPLGTALKQLNEPPPLDGEGAARLPRSVVPVLRRALAKARDARYDSAREMGRALEALRPGLAATAVLAPTERSLADRETIELRTRGEGTTEAAAPERATPPPLPTEADPVAPAEGTPAAAERSGPVPFLAAALVALALALASGVWLWRRAGEPVPAVPVATERPAAAPAASPGTPPPPEPSASPVALARAAALAPSRSVPQPGSPPTPAASPAPARSEGPVAGARGEPPVDALVDRLLAEADAALEAQDFDAAIARYDEILRLDPRNAVARMGRTGAITAKVARAPAPRAAARSFTAGKTVAESAETRADSSLASAFDNSTGIEVSRDSQAAALPGRIEFRTEPEVVRPGERYKLEVRFVNAGASPIAIREMVVTSVVDGRNAGGPVPPAATTVAPGQGATLLSITDTLREGLKSWALEVRVRTTRGEIYRNRLAWTGP